MNKKDLQHFKRILLAERERLTEGLGQLEKDVLYQPMTDATNLMEAGTDTTDRETALAVVGSETEYLREIDEALDRIEEGSYGVCEGTGEAIPKKRLEVFPTARYCVEYQEQLERENRDNGWRR